jgi:Ca-activated chloride channel homolog
MNFDIHWAGLNNFVYLPFFLIAAFFLIKNYSDVKRYIFVLVNRLHQDRFLRNFSLVKFLLKTLFMLIALGVLFIALLRPQWEKKDQVIEQEGRDLLVVLDISRSMLAQDLKPSRLEFVKLKIRALLNKLNFERVGLILFSGTAFVQCPLTIDYKTFLMFLDQVDVETIASGTTAIDSALQKAVDVYAKAKDRKNKLVLLVTDGEDFSLELASVKNIAREKNITVLALGIGTMQGAPIPVVDLYGHQQGHEVDKKGNVVLSKLNEALLQKISNELNGIYVHSSHNDSDLDRIVGFIGKFEKEHLDDKKFSLYEDKYPWFLGAAWFFLALEWIL